MEYTQLGRSGLSVSRLCLGTMNFGPVTDVEDSHAIMDRAHELGINFFDSANVYGGPEHKGRTESIVGNWFSRGDGRREKTVLATKVYNPMGSNWPNDGKLSALSIRRACDASLKRLQTDYIDLYQMHHIDRTTPWDEIWEGFETLRQQGKIIYAGSSNFAGWHLAKAQEAARRRQFNGLAAEQSLYNLAERTVELEVLPAALDYGIGVIPWSPLHGGMLGGVLRKQDRTRSGGKTGDERLAKYRPQVEAYEAYADELEVDPANLALAWLLHQPTVTAPIIGPRTLGQLDGAVKAVDIALDEKALLRLDEIWPGPGGAAPEAYAW
jgi:aryl-alcohol dehydrogenase-like predicted oxidoreductase